MHELKKLASGKTLTEEAARRCRELMQQPRPRRPNQAVILHPFTATEDWQLSVKAGDTVTVLDKLDDGWWLVDKSCQARGPFGLVPGMRCCWILHDDPEDVVSMPKVVDPPPPLPPRPPEQPTYSQADLDAAFDYMRKLVYGDGFQAIPPANFNELCLDDDFATKVRDYADDLRKRRSHGC